MGAPPRDGSMGLFGSYVWDSGHARPASHRGAAPEDRNTSSQRNRSSRRRRVHKLLQQLPAVSFGTRPTPSPGQGSDCPLWAMCGRLPVGKRFSDVLSFGRCGHVCGLLLRHTKAAGHNAFR